MNGYDLHSVALWSVVQTIRSDTYIGVMRSYKEAMANRFEFIDGLRGIAACQVVLLHYCAAFLPTMARVGGSPHYAWESSITRSPFFVVLHKFAFKLI